MPGLVRLKQLKDCTIWYDAPGGFTLQLYTDMVGNTTQGVLALAATLNFPATAGRQTFTLPLDNLYATELQFKGSSSGRVILLGGVIRVIDIGTYFLGQFGEIYDSTILSLGMP